MLNFLPGKKTYIAGIISIALGVVEIVAPGMLPTVGDPMTLITQGLIALGLRKGIKNDTL